MAVLDLGLVPDEVLLRCGRPASVPSAWWTPSLVGLADGEAEARRGAAEAFLRASGMLDAAGVLAEPLASVAAVVGAATTVVTWELDGAPADAPGRGALVAAGEHALVSLQQPDVGAHHLLVVDPVTAVGWLAEALDPAGTATTTTAPEHVGPDGLGARLAALAPQHERLATLRLASCTTGGDDGEPGELLVTVLVTATRVTACWARPDGGAVLQGLDLDGVVALAGHLLGATGAVTAA